MVCPSSCRLYNACLSPDVLLSVYSCLSLVDYVSVLRRAVVFVYPLTVINVGFTDCGTDHFSPCAFASTVMVCDPASIHVYHCACLRVCLFPHRAFGVYRYSYSPWPCLHCVSSCLSTPSPCFWRLLL